MPKVTYAKAGVDVDKVRVIQRSLASQLGATFRFRRGRPGAPLRPIGLYAGLVDLGNGDALAMHTDGVGTKVLVAQEMKKFDTVGIDCVAMTVNDLLCVGSEPIALLDYIALEREDDRLVSELARGLAEGARLSSVAIVGGETAIARDVIKGKDGMGFDMASMGVGLVKTSEIVDGSSIVEGDTLVGIASSGLHSNGYTLARKVLRGTALSKYDESLGKTLGESLLEPTSIYVSPVLAALRRCEVHGIAHITGGSFSKLTRLLGGRRLAFDLALPAPPPIFRLIMERGVSKREMYKTFNMGIGMILAVPQSEAGKVVRVIRSSGFHSHDLGAVRRGEGVRVNGMRTA